MLCTTLRTCSKTISAHKASHPYCNSWLLGLNIGFMHRGVIRSSYCRIPRDWSTACDMAVKTLTDCLTNTLSCMHVHTQALATTCLRTHMCTQNRSDRLFHQLHRLDWHLFSWVSSKLPACRGKYNNLALQGLWCHCYSLKSYFSSLSLVAKLLLYTSLDVAKLFKRSLQHPYTKSAHKC